MDPQRCQCGCGQVTNFYRGKYKSFRQGHYARVHPPKWNGGRKQKHPYTLILLPNHHRADSSGYVREHILQAEKALGKPLPKGVVVHHHTPDQLVICQSLGYHRTLHKRMDALFNGGHANWVKCRFCKKYNDPKNMAEHKRKKERESQSYYHHLSCHANYEKNRRHLKLARQNRRQGVFD